MSPSITIDLTSIAHMQDDDDELTILKLKDDSKVADSKTIVPTTTLKLPHIAMPGLRIAIDGATDSSGDFSWQRP